MFILNNLRAEMEGKEMNLWGPKFYWKLFICLQVVTELYSQLLFVFTELSWENICYLKKQHRYNLVSIY